MKGFSLIWIVLFTNVCIAGNGITWPVYEKKAIPDSLSGENAVFLQNVTTIDFNTAGETNLIVFKRIAINSLSSADNLSKQEFYVDNDARLGRLFGRIIKANGIIEELEDIDKYKTKITEKNEYGTSTLTKYQVLYSNVAPGDVIDLYYEIKLDRYIFSNILYLEDEWNSLYSRITLRNYSRLDITAFVFNETIQPETKVIDGIPTVSWGKEGVGKSKVAYFNAPRPNQACLIFNLWDPLEALTYDAVFHYDVNKFPDNYSKLKSLDKALVETSIINQNDPIALKVQKLIKYFEGNFNWVENLQVDPLSKLNAHFSGQSINDDVFFYYIQKLLSENNAMFYRCYSKSLLDGNFIHGAVALKQLDSRYVLFFDELKAQHFIFQPTSSGKYYYLDEVPFYCEGNQSIAMSGENVTLSKLLQVVLPQSNNNENTHLAKCMFKILSDSSASMRRDDDFSGQFSFLLRGKGEKYWLKELNISDTLLQIHQQENLYPYSKKYKQDTIVNFQIKVLNDTLSWFSLNEFLPLSFFEDEEEENEFGSYVVLPFLKNESFSFYLSGEQFIKFGELFSDKLTNAVGRVEVSSFQLSENMVKITYYLNVEKRILESSDDTQNFTDLVRFWDDVTVKKWLVNVK